jgi:hypothetical protein
VLYLLGLLFIGGVIWVALHALPLFLVGGLGWDDLRSVILHRAYQSFTFEGDVIPGVRPSLGARLVIRILSPEYEARRTLVTKALAATEKRVRPGSGMVRSLSRMSTRMTGYAAMSRAVEQARWFARPPLSAYFRP